MNKVVLTTLTMSAVIFISGCSSSGSHRSKQGSFYANDNCPSCGHGRSAVRHGHSGSSSSGSGLATVAGALLVGGLIYNALDDDDSSSSHGK